MGYNRSGQRFKERMRRRRNEERRLAMKEAGGAGKPHGVVAKAKDSAKEAVEKAGKVIKAPKRKVTGKE
jgi:hypothetical protein